MNCYFTYQKLSKLSKTCLLRRQKLHWPRLILATRYCIWLVMFYFIIKFITLFYVALPLRGYITHCTRLPLCPVPVYNSRTKSCIWSFEQKVSRFICNSPTSFEVRRSRSQAFECWDTEYAITSTWTLIPRRHSLQSLRQTYSENATEHWN